MVVKTAVTDAERKAAALTDPDIPNEAREDQDQDTIELEEMAALYVSVGGKDERALKLFQAAKDAGRIDSNGNWVNQE